MQLKKKLTGNFLTKLSASSQNHQGTLTKMAAKSTNRRLNPMGLRKLPAKELKSEKKNPTLQAGTEVTKKAPNIP